MTEARTTQAKEEVTEVRNAPTALDRSSAESSGALAVLTLSQDIGEAESDGREPPCRIEDPELWFAETPAALEQAKVLCGSCPVRRACLAGAIERREPWGVWGGELFERGVIIPRKRPRGRPRKDAAA